MRDYSQHGEYTFLKDYFKQSPCMNKTLVDVGAKNASGSNSYNLIMEDGWKGLLIEPDKCNFKDLQDVYNGTDVIIENTAIADFNGRALFYIAEKAGHHSLLRKTDKCVPVECRLLGSVLDNHSIPRDFGLLTIDAEGMDLRILTNVLTTTTYRPSVVIAEKYFSKDIFSDVFNTNGYTFLHQTKGNVIYKKV
jgi:FkbM family methyltransferase